MVSFSLRLRISYLLLQDSSLVSFHLIQFEGSAISGKSLYTPTQIGWNADKHGPFLAARTMNPSDYFPKTKLNGSVRLVVMPQNLNYEARTPWRWEQPRIRYATQL
jgi:hypothetical protein